VPELCNLAKTITHAGIDAYRTAVWASGANNHYNSIDTHYVIIQISGVPTSNISLDHIPNLGWGEFSYSHAIVSPALYYSNIRRFEKQF